MNTEQHIKIAQWHLEQARLHAINNNHKCGYPPNEHDQKAIDTVEAGLHSIQEELTCSAPST